MPKVYICYGFAEGDWNSQLFRKTLERDGHIVTSDISEANIVIAHSGGCYVLPTEKKFDLVLLVDVTFWPEKSFVTKLKDKVSRDTVYTYKHYGSATWLNKTLRSFGYTLIQPRRARAMYIGMKGDSCPSVSAKKIVVVRNRNDPWLSQTFHEAFTMPEVTFISLPGEHDDIWENPDRYIQLLRTAH